MKPAAFSTQLRAHSPRGSALMVRAVLFVALLGVCALLLPWQQSSRASGQVIAWDPNDRIQTVDTPVEGRLLRVHVREGTVVKEGDVLVEVADIDPDYARRLQTEAGALESRVATARAAVLEMEGRVLDLQESRMRAVAAAEARFQAASERRLAAEQRVLEADAQLERDQLQLSRREQGLAQGVASQRDLEVATADARRSEAARAQALTAVEAARAEEKAAREERARVEAEADANVAQAKAARDSSEMSEQSAVADLARAEVRVSRQATQVVRAPRSGRISRIVANPGSELLKPGDPLVELVPDAKEWAVELRVPGRDQPLLGVGAQVRIQFEGWPAIAFVGPPGGATGTFGGTVRLVDPSGDPASGTVRVVVSPDEGAPWPSAERLRQGSRAVGWVLLGEVPLGYELWRQLHGFPASPSAVVAGGKGGKDAKEKGK
jgi:multidrug efflux pump subunit AcrA (membrane-fusion protein)